MPTTGESLFSKKRLGQMHDVMAGHVERGEVPGLVTLVSSRGEIHVDAIGRVAFDGPLMARDTIFRITSMTKPVTAAAAMILVEEGKLQLDDPVDRWLPELADRKVLRRLDAPIFDTVPGEARDYAARPFDLPLRLRHDPGIPRALSDPAGVCGCRSCAGTCVSVLSAG